MNTTKPDRDRHGLRGVPPPPSFSAAPADDGQLTEEEAAACLRFSDRGFSKRTITMQIAHGIDAPDRLLFATEADLKTIPGIGKASFEEIMRYRTRFIPEPLP